MSSRQGAAAICTHAGRPATSSWCTGTRDRRQARHVEDRREHGHRVAVDQRQQRILVRAFPHRAASRRERRHRGCHEDIERVDELCHQRASEELCALHRFDVARSSRSPGRPRGARGSAARRGSSPRSARRRSPCSRSARTTRRTRPRRARTTTTSNTSCPACRERVHGLRHRGLMHGARRRSSIGGIVV